MTTERGTGIYKEVNLPPFEAVGDWREFSLPSDAPLVNENIREFGSGFYYRSNSPWTRNRSIIWRVYGDSLDLCEVSFDLKLRGNAIRIRFGHNIIPDVAFFEVTNRSQRCLVIFVATDNNKIYRFVFTHPDSLNQALQFDNEQIYDSIFAQTSLDWLTAPEHVVPSVCRHLTPASLCVINQNTVVLGCNGGTVVCVEMDDIGHLSGPLVHAEMEMKEASVIKKLWNGLLPAALFKSHSNYVEYLAVHGFSDDVFIFALSTDKLRVWSVRKKALVTSLTLMAKSWENQEPAQIQRKAMKFLADRRNPAHFRIVFFLSLESQSQFQTFSGEFQATGQVTLDYDGVSHYDNDELVDFQLTHDSIWALYRRVSDDEEDFSLEHTSLPQKQSDQESSEWNQSVLEDPNDELDILDNAVFINVEDVFIDKIFEPGRFSFNTLCRAYEQFTKANQTYKPTDVFNLKTEVINEVQQEVATKLTADDMTDEALFQFKASIWTRYLQCCLRCWLDENQPLGVFVNPNSGFVSVVKRSCVSVLRPCSSVEAISTYFSYTSNTTEQVLEALGSPAAACEPSINADVVNLLSSMHFVSQQLGPSALFAFEEDLYYLVDMAEAALPLIALLSRAGDQESISKEQQLALRTFMMSFSEKLRAIKDPVRAVSKMLDLITASRLNDAPANASFGDLFFSDMMEVFLARSYRQVVKNKFNLLRDLFFVVLLMARCRDRLAPSLSFSAVQNLSVSIMPRLISSLKSAFLAQWLSKQHADIVLTTPSVETSISQIMNLDISGRKKITFSRKTDGFTTLTEYYSRSVKYPLLTQFAKHKSVQDFITEKRFDFWELTEPFVQTFVEMIECTGEFKQDLKTSFPYFLLRKKQFNALQEYVRLIDAKSGYLNHLLGELYLSHEEFDKAQDCFHQSAVAISNKQEDLLRQLIDTNLSVSTDVTNAADLYIQKYWLLQMQILDKQNLPDLLVHAAYEALNSSHDVQTQSYLWSNIFKNSLSVGHYDQAYLAMISNPDPSRREDCLRRFLVVMCENKELKTMLTFPFIGLVDQVHNVLLTKARRSDVTELPNYYDILYAFHTLRGNYRQAASAIYEFSQRVAVESHSQGVGALQQQARSLLATINALKLVDPKFAWILIKQKKMSHPTSPKRKFGQEVPLDPREYGMVDVESARAMQNEVKVIDLREVERRYLLTQANITLGKRSQALHVSGVLMSPQDTMTMLAQNGFFDMAIALGHAFDLDLQRVFETLTKKCLQVSNTTDIDYENEDWLRELSWSYSNVRTACWILLEKYLKKYDSNEKGFKYHIAVADRILSTDTRIKLPLWLVAAFKQGVNQPTKTDANGMEVDEEQILFSDNSAALLKLYLKHDLLEEATEIAMYMFKNTKGVLETKKTDQAYLPYTLVDQLLQQLKTAKFDKLQQQIENSMQSYFNVVYSGARKIK
jgi:nuclear pore complex protein Nup160